MKRLHLITIPIGNLLDITKRAEESLRNGREFAVEDTRSFRNFLSQLGLDPSSKTIHSFHDQSEALKADELLDRLETDDLYFVSEAGSPIVSDPAFPLVQAALKRGFALVNSPGVSSVITALELSGLPPHPFHFSGFFPRERGDREREIERAKVIGGTQIYFESPHRIIDALDHLTEKLPEVDFAIARELTKKFETVHRFKGENWHLVKTELTVKGEFVILFYLEADARATMSPEITSLTHEYLSGTGGPKTLSKLLSRISGRPQKEIYTLLNRNV